MSCVPIIPTHEADHIDRTAEALRAVGPRLAEQWNQAIAFFREGKLYEAFLEQKALASEGDLPDVQQTDVQLQLIRCIRYAPTRRIEEEHRTVVPRDDYQATVWWYRYGWYCLHRSEKYDEAVHYLKKAKARAREIDSRPWECAAQLQLGWTDVQRGLYDEAREHFTRVYNLSRRNGLVEYISKTSMGKGRAYIDQGEYDTGQEHLAKAFELAQRNNLAPEEGIALLHLAKYYHYDRGFYGLAAEYYHQVQERLEGVTLWPNLENEIDWHQKACEEKRNNLDIAKLIGPLPIDQLRQKYLSGLVNGFVGIPGIENRSQLGERVDLTRQAIHRNINK
jgi:tetratricopeptide (TPR) repeat protein